MFIEDITKMVSHILTVAVPLLIIVPAAMSMNLFSLHPILMSVAYLFLMSQGMMLFSASSTLIPRWPRNDKVNLHLKLLLSALICAIGGFAAIYYNKVLNGRSHFLTWHGYLGALTVGYTLMQVLAGVALKYNRYIMPHLPKTFTLALWKQMHAFSGVTCYCTACIVAFLGVYSTWYTGAVHEYVWCACVIGIVFLFGTAINHGAELGRSILHRQQQQRPKPRSVPATAKQ